MLVVALVLLLPSVSYALLTPRNLTARATPAVKATTSYGSLNNNGLNRDSCTSTAWSASNVLWTCRDTQQLNSAALRDRLRHPQPSIPQGFGSPFYPLEGDQCPSSGACSDGTRWVGWPDSGAAVVFNLNGAVNAYAFIKRQHLSGLSTLNTPDTTLYHVSQSAADTSVMPGVSVATSKFWGANQVGYGSAASVLSGSFIYLYGTTPSGQLAVARSTLTGFLGALTDKSTYEYYVNGAWTKSAPTTSTANIALSNTRSAQGTIYFSPKWNSFVWIGGDGFPNANFYISTAPAPEGPWTSPTLFYTGALGTGSLPAYSAVAHPALTDGSGNYIFITWTKTIKNSAGTGDIYEQPLVRVDWA
ncbi:hypothetical protein MKEN_00571600 [Mycena kentingensis (nom. inval.)]|nr:hypothetical protein MKEN_00571600 [Mycena kentingensis (nom. inval.)]